MCITTSRGIQVVLALHALVGHVKQLRDGQILTPRPPPPPVRCTVAPHT